MALWFFVTFNQENFLHNSFSRLGLDPATTVEIAAILLVPHHDKSPMSCFNIIPPSLVLFGGLNPLKSDEGQRLDFLGHGEDASGDFEDGKNVAS
jgi:hypothetical protein